MTRRGLIGAGFVIPFAAACALAVLLKVFDLSTAAAMVAGCGSLCGAALAAFLHGVLPR